MTTFTQTLASPTGPPMERLRDAMRFVPRPINELVFDASLAVSLGLSYGTTTPLPE